MSAPPKAIVAGASGHVGSGLMEQLAREGVAALGVTRSPRPGTASAHVAIDLLDRGAVRAALADALADVTHVYYCARAPFRDGGGEDVAENVAMLRNLVESADDMAPLLSDVHIVEGGKWYDFASGSAATPAREDQPLPAARNFYHAQQEWLQDFQSGKRWRWSASRPSYVCAVRPGHGRNLVSTLGAYAAIRREESTVLDFPGDGAAFHALTEVTERNLLGRSILHLTSGSRARNAAFNVTNGDHFTWAEFWPRLAARFEMTPGEPRARALAPWMTEKADLWTDIVRKSSLQQLPLDAVAHFPFADFLFGQKHDVASNTDRLHDAGFPERIDSLAMLEAMLDEYRALRILP